MRAEELAEIAAVESAYQAAESSSSVSEETSPALTTAEAPVFSDEEFARLTWATPKHRIGGVQDRESGN